MVQPATANKGGGRFVAFVEKSWGEKMATKDFLSATKPLARSRALLLVASVVLAVLVACGVAAVAKLEPAKAAFPGKNGAIAFSSNEGSAGNGFQVWRVNPNGSGKSMLTDFPTDNHNLNPAWSADGKKIAFTSYRDGDTEIYVMGATGLSAGQPPVMLTNNAVYDTVPVWSPDGQTIAFVRWLPRVDNSPNYEIFAMNADGTGKTNITKTPDASEDAPAYSPNGKRIAFSSNRDGRNGIWKMGANGSHPTQLTAPTTEFYSTGPDWQPLP